jgi:hypothetical protein
VTSLGPTLGFMLCHKFRNDKAHAGSKSRLEHFAVKLTQFVSPNALKPLV